MAEAKILVIDIETTPNLADVWGLWQQNVGLSQLKVSSALLCFAAKWHKADWSIFYSDWNNTHDVMVRKAHQLLDEADAVVHYNGKRFDVPHLNREFLLAGLKPPSPYKQIDLLQQVKSNFKFPSNKLDYVASTVLGRAKVKHEGHELWTKVLAGDPVAQMTMQTYNLQDVALTEDLYDAILPWITGHPHLGLFVDESRPVCSRCGSTRMQKRGVSYTGLSAFQRYRCQDCGGWSRGGQRVNAVSVRGVS